MQTRRHFLPTAAFGVIAAPNILRAQNTKQKIRVFTDFRDMLDKNAPEFDAWIKEPVRDGWSYGEDLWKA